MNIFTKTPPMGWNSWDCYGAAVNELQVRANAEYMAKHLKRYGWEYIVVDIQWFEPNASSHCYNENAELVTDGYGRLMPAINRFPSASDGRGFTSLSEYIHSLGLKFGIHILRGIPKQAVRKNMPVKGTNHTASEIADFGSVCDWNGDMCGVDMTRDGAQAYYNSIFELYAQWGVDFVKVDDIARPYREKEIEAVAKAIECCGRDMVLSLSPGAAPLSAAAHLGEYAGMWRMTDDFWDNWDALKKMFDYCRDWFPYVKEGHWPDCDMLPLGKLRLCSAGGGDYTRFTKDEQRLLMTLWCIFRSPLMFGGDMPSNDAFTLSLMQNTDLLYIHQNTFGGREVYRRGDEILWAANDADGIIFAAVFNIGDTELNCSVNTEFLGTKKPAAAKELWTGKELTSVNNITDAVPPHGVRLYRLTY